MPSSSYSSVRPTNVTFFFFSVEEPLLLSLARGSSSDLLLVFSTNATSVQISESNVMTRLKSCRRCSFWSACCSMNQFYVVVDVSRNENADDPAVASFPCPVDGDETNLSNVGFKPAWFRGALNSSSPPSSSSAPSHIFRFARVGVNTFFEQSDASYFFGAVLLWRSI